MGHGNCCSPAAEREGRGVSARRAPAGGTNTANDAEDSRAMVALAGGEFLMGTDYAQAFAADGEGPVRRVRLLRAL